MFDDLHYGWKIAAGITLAATTIFIVDNQRQRINQADIIEIALGVHERCLATEYTTNAYRVNPPSFVRSWISNDYQYDGTNWSAVSYTNLVTNTIGWRIDRAMMVDLDTKIKELIPYFVNTNVASLGGTTNEPLSLTVTGLWAELNIGDGTNKFTKIPASGTNEAVYGGWANRIYKIALEERYKVLYSLSRRWRTPNHTIEIKRANRDSGGTTTNDTWDNVVATERIAFNNEEIITNEAFSSGSVWNYTRERTHGSLRLETTNEYHAWLKASAGKYGSWIHTNISQEVDIYAKPIINNVPEAPCTETTFDDGGYNTPLINMWNLIDSGINTGPWIMTDWFGDEDLNADTVTWCDEPVSNGCWNLYVHWVEYKGVDSITLMSDINFQFNYCTNAYWE